jgi:hypothetical protein
LAKAILRRHRVNDPTKEGTICLSAPSNRELEHALHEGGSLVALSRWPRTLSTSDQRPYAVSAFVARATFSSQAPSLYGTLAVSERGKTDRRVTGNGAFSNQFETFELTSLECLLAE